MIIKKNWISFANPNYGLKEYEINMAILIQKQVNK